MTKQKIQNVVENLIDDLNQLTQYGPKYSRDARRWMNINHDLHADPFSAYEIVQGFAILRASRGRFSTYARMEKSYQRLRHYLS